MELSFLMTVLRLSEALDMQESPSSDAIMTYL